ncbi:DUF6493 family protein [Lacihabitans soyangensis]|uniref:WGR domain-containing protein n=1 Tax=Lacihabitans soyangensis TaxID=869394 RepID=A0AAE3H236_9BACT|nr:DUF6493 family protein [Lacihabitans soyangensis]MCP9763547.1 WGR domain-containing protein [Lacihabitans soyangensis]
MIHYLTFQNGDSDKFWQIETNGTTFTVKFGKIGTEGQSQTKTYDTEEVCIQEAQKKIEEKLKKGYQDSQGNNHFKKIANSKITFDESDFKIIIGEYESIIIKKKAESLLPFLEKVPRIYRESLKKHVKIAKKYWTEYVEISKPNKLLGNSYGTWGYRGDNTQQEIIFLSAIALFNKKEILSWQEINSILGKFDNILLKKILKWAAPNWIEDYFNHQSSKNNWFSISYEILRYYETEKYINFNPQLYARSFSMINLYNSGFKQGQESVDFFCNDPLSIERDFPLIFDYETGIQNSFGNDEVYGYRKKAIWEGIIEKLLLDNKIDRIWFFEKCLETQTKEWNNGLKTFFRGQFNQAKPTNLELLTLQNSIFPLIDYSFNQVANWSISLIKEIYQENDFELKKLCDWLPSIMMRDDCKSSIKSILTMFEKILKKDPNLKSDILNLATDALTINNLELQEKASKLILKYIDTNDIEIIEKLEMYTTQMVGNIRDTFHEYLESKDTKEIPSYVEEMIPKGNSYIKLSKPVNIPDNWNDILFHIGKFIESNNCIDDEILIDILISKRHLFPNDFYNQTEVYLKKMEKTFFTSFFKNITLNFAKKQLSKQTIEFEFPYYYDETTLFKIFNLHYDRLKLALDKIQRKSTLSLLSMPSHEPNWISPKVLLTRLLEYQDNAEPIILTDFVLAISRMPREETEEAIEMCEQIQNQDIKDIMKYCLGESNEIKFKEKKRSIFNMFSKNENAKGEENLNALWSVASRTFNNEGEFPIFENTSFGNAPYVKNNLKYNYKVDEKWNEWKNHQTGEISKSPSWYKFSFPLPSPFSIPKILIYSVDSFKNPKQEAYESYFYIQKDDVVYWYNLSPQFIDPIFAKLLNTCSSLSDRDYSGIGGGLTILLNENLKVTSPILMFLSTACLQQNREFRGLAVEVMIVQLNSNNINLEEFGKNIGFLIFNKYGPLSRFVNVLETLKDINNHINLSLLKIVEQIILNFRGVNEFPTNFKKMLEVYFDLMNKTRQKSSHQVIEIMNEWRSVNSIKNIIKLILNA